MTASPEPGSDPPDSGKDHVVMDWSPSGVVTTMWVAMSFMLGILGLMLFGLVYALFGAETPGQTTAALDPPVVAALTVLIMVLHQLLHAAASRLTGGSPSFDLDVVQWIFPVLFVRVTGQRFRRLEYIAYLLAPLGLLSVLGIIVMLLDHRGAALIIPLAVNTGMSMRDIWTAWIVLRQRSDVLVEGRKDGFRMVREYPASDA